MKSTPNQAYKAAENRRPIYQTKGRQARQKLLVVTEEGNRRQGAHIRSMVVTKEGIRKGPWTEQEDLQLVCFVSLFGERRWDFIAKVSGLNRTGKSCRLRWVNYLHPGLKRGRITPQEERLILELVLCANSVLLSSRWSRIARRLPGRTDNEIKNYWRTHMRKIAQERKKSSPLSSSTCSSESEQLEEASGMEQHEQMSYMMTRTLEIKEEEVKVYSMDQIWNEIAGTGTMESTTGGLRLEKTGQEACNISCNSALMASPVWENCAESPFYSLPSPSRASYNYPSGTLARSPRRRRRTPPVKSRSFIARVLQD